MSVPRYPAYKCSGIEWIGEVPEHWSIDRMKWAIEQPKNGIWGDEECGDDNDIPCVRVADFDRQRLRVRLNEPTIRNVLPRERAGRILENNDILIEKSGGGELQPVGCVVMYQDSRPAICSNFVAKTSARPGMSASYWCYMHSAAYSARINTRSIKQTSGIQNLDQSQYLNELACYPPFLEQERIAIFLDSQTAKVDALIEEQQRLIRLVRERLKALALSGYGCSNGRLERIGRLVEIISRPVFISDDLSYKPLGLYNKGRGLFHKEPRPGSQMGESDFFYVENGDLIISGQFAWEGAVALAGDNENGCVVSHRYPVIRGNQGCCLTEFLLALLWTEHGDFLLNQSSRGAAGRNKPLNLDLLLKEEIKIPEPSIQEEIKHLVWTLQGLEKECACQREIALERKKALIFAAVTGKIDVRGLAPGADPA